MGAPSNHPVLELPYFNVPGWLEALVLAMCLLATYLALSSAQWDDVIRSSQGYNSFHGLIASFKKQALDEDGHLNSIKRL